VKRDVLFLFLTVLLAVLSESCGGGKTGGDALTVQITAPLQSPFLDQAQSVTIKAEVINDPSNAGVTWTLGPPSDKGTVGTLTNMSNAAVTYIAPDSVTKETRVTVTASSITDPSRAAVMGIVIEPLPVITTQSSDLLPAFVGSDYLTTINQTGGVPPYTWVVSQGLLPDGLSISTDPTVVNPPGVTITTEQNVIYFTGKPTTSEIANFTLQVTDSTGVAAHAALSLGVNPKPLNIQLPALVSGRVGQAYTPTELESFTGVPPFTWSVLSGDLPPGLSLSSDGIISGTPTQVGSFAATVEVSDSQAPLPAIGMAFVQILIDEPNDSCPSGQEGNLSSQPYAFLLRGFDADGPVIIAGSFTGDGQGNITGGVEDINRASGVQTNLTINPTGSSYTLGDNRGCLTLTNSAGTTTLFRFSMGGLDGSTPSLGRIIEFDDNTGGGTRASGILRLQDPSSFSTALSGLYAFGLRGQNAAGGSFAMAGSANASAGLLSSVAADINDGGALSSALTGGSGSYSAGANGRGSASFSVGSSAFNLALYMLDSAHAFFLSTDPLSSAHPLVSGEAVLTAGPFTNASLKDNHIFHETGISSAGPDVSLGVLSFDGKGKFAATLFEDNAGTIVLDPVTGRIVILVSGDYSVDADTGRVVLSGPDAGAHPPVLYIVPATSGVTGFLVGTDSAAASGQLQYQVPDPPQFTALSVFGNYIFGTDSPADAATSNFEGLISADGKAAFSGIQDASPPQADGLFPNQFLAGPYTILVDGTGTFGGNTVSVTNGSVVFYVDESLINLHPALMIVEK
jgi:hypothetical protein